MWSIPDGKCFVPNSSSIMIAASNNYRYPTGINPGDIIYDPSRRKPYFKEGSLFYLILFHIFPLIIGSIILLFLVTTIVYLCFTVLRLFYLDTLKPYKVRTLKQLGKHYRKTPLDKRYLKKYKRPVPDINTEEEGQGEDRMRRKTPAGELFHPPGVQLSFTSPPIHLSPSEPPEEDHPNVIDLINARKPPGVQRFPVPLPSRYYGGPGERPHPTRIPVPLNRPRGPWIWDPNWYKKQLQAEAEVKRTVTKLLEARGGLSTTASERFNFDVTAPPTAKPEAPIPRYVSYTPKQDLPPKVEQVEPPPPPPKPVEAPRSVSPSRAELFQRYTFKQEPTKESQAFTAIPKPDKGSYTSKLMILRAGPRRNSDQMKDILKQKRANFDQP